MRRACWRITTTSPHSKATESQPLVQVNEVSHSYFHPIHVALELHRNWKLYKLFFEKV
jgi:hypothetical protein